MEGLISVLKEFIPTQKQNSTAFNAYQVWNTEAMWLNSAKREYQTPALTAKRPKFFDSRSYFSSYKRISEDTVKKQYKLQKLLARERSPSQFVRESQLEPFKRMDCLPLLCLFKFLR